GVKGSSTFQSLPNWAKTSVVTALAASRDNMPAIIGIVEKQRGQWRGMQRNSDAASSGSSHPKIAEKPANKDAAVAAQGKENASSTHSNQVEASKVGLQASSSILNEGLGVSGEHNADYICAGEFGWGKDWDGHDKGADGSGFEGVPSASKLGKLSKGGSPKARHVLYKLTDGAHGTGIDASWRADPATNYGNNFAVVEAKASRNEHGPKFMREANNTRKPGVASKLGISGATGPSELLETLELEAPSARKTDKFSGSKNSSAPTVKKNNSIKKPKQILQISLERIRANNESAVPKTLIYTVLISYSRHLFHAPLYHPKQNPKDHAFARLNNSYETSHANHSAFHYHDREVKSFVQKRKQSIAVKYEKLSLLNIE
ncbi:hypothetical protein, partial [Pseudomonas quasicaspiana]|uniref:hypothetical protein n=1 Tax=Pseudomonas quasicaspiana TaxID=2829821 RepID=UPI001E290EF5